MDGMNAQINMEVSYRSQNENAELADKAPG